MHFVFVLLFLMIIFLMIGISQSSQSAPGLLWKVQYSDFPELFEIWEHFKQSCIVPDIPESWFIDTSENKVFQEMRMDALLLNQESKYELFETKPMRESIWSSEIMKFYSDQYMISAHVSQTPEVLFSQERTVFKCQTRQIEYTPRLGAYHRHISSELEIFASQKINELMKRLGLSNKLNKLTDSRGATFTPAGGFMEAHTNRLHLAGWRIYLHFLPEHEKQSSFIYKHCYDNSVRIIPDTNNAANLFRIRKLPDKLLWHAIHTDRPRFSWGLWVPPELAQFLKSKSLRM